MLKIVMLISAAFASADILVELPNGKIRGREASTTTNNTFYAFQKIPFATPPVGNLRFKAPLPAENWDGILNTTENNVVCYQMAAESSDETEDCLYLNVYTPRLPSENDEDLLPVMFYIYGGGFVRGNCLISACGPEFLIDGGVVVVTINYRLGPFGFLSTEDTVIPGNNGLKDQLLALQWTHDNIRLFGGDADKITIFGQSAGSASVTYQFLNKKAEGLFRGAICESGSFLSPWAFQRRAREIAFETAAFLNETFKTSNDSEALLEFLLSVSAEDIDDASDYISATEGVRNRQLSQGFFYAPVVELEHEEAFITEKMYVSLKSGNFIKVPIVMGINSEESITSANNLDNLKRDLTQLDQNLAWLVPDDMRIDDEGKRTIMGSSIRNLYSGDYQLQDNLGSGIRYYSDTSFTRSVIRHAELQSQFSDVYFYQFSYDGEIGNVFTTIEGAEKVAHSEENNYIWRKQSSSYDNGDLSKFPEEDVITLRRIQKIWTDFAKTLNPTPEPSDLMQHIQWPTVSSGEKFDFLYLDIDVNLTVKNHPKWQTYNGWTNLYAGLGYDDFDTY